MNELMTKHCRECGARLALAGRYRPQVGELAGLLYTYTDALAFSCPRCVQAEQDRAALVLQRAGWPCPRVVA